MNAQEIRLRCIEAAAKLGTGSHAKGPACGIVDMASVWFDWIISTQGPAADPEPTLEKIAENASMLY